MCSVPMKRIKLTFLQTHVGLGPPGHPLVGIPVGAELALVCQRTVLELGPRHNI